MTNAHGSYAVEVQLRNLEGEVLSSCKPEAPFEALDPPGIVVIPLHHLAMEIPAPGKYEVALNLFEQARDLVWLQAERLPLQAPREQPGRNESDGKRRQQRGGESGKLAQQALDERRLEEANRDHADDASLVVDGRLAAGRHAEGAALHAHPRVSRQHRAGILVDGLPDQRRVRVREPNPPRIRDDHVACVSGVAN